MRKIVALVFILIAFLKLEARNFYFSSVSGNDSYTSLQAQNSLTPWKTLAKLTSFFSSLLPGDSVLLHRNETFYGSILVNKSGTSFLPIVIGAYSTGSKPIISGLTDMSGWVSTGTNVWTSAANGLLGSSVKIVLDDNVLLHVGRYPNLDAPNSGYLLFESSTANSITDNQLLNTPNWTGAQVVVRILVYLTDTRTITNHSGTLVTTDPFSSTPSPIGGYFFQNSLLALDQQGEYYYNSATKKLSIYSTTQPTNIQVATSGQLIKSTNFSYITIDGLSFIGATDSAISIIGTTGGTGIKIQNCTVNFCGANGIIVNNHDNILIQNDSVLNCLSNGIRLNGGHNDIIRGNYILNSYAIAGMGTSGLSGMGIYLPISTGALIDSNTIINSGWNGIRFNGDNVICKNNYVDTYAFIKDDAGGIYTAPAPGTTRTGEQILNNVVLHGIGARDGSRFNAGLAYGIYLDDNSSNFIISGNSLAYGTSGIFLHNGHNNVVRDNTAFGFSNAQLFYDEDNGGTTPIRDLVSKNNIAFAQLANQKTLFATSVINAIGLWGGDIDSNFYLRPLDDNLTIRNISTAISLPMWKTAFPAYDIHTVRSPLSLSNANQIAFYYNETGATKNINLIGSWRDARSQSYSGTVVLQPYSSLALMSAGNLLNPTITWPNPVTPITYGTALGSSEYNHTANVAGTFADNHPTGTILNAGLAQTLSTVFTPSDPLTYSSVSKSVLIDVNPAPASLSFSVPTLTQTWTGLPLAPSIITNPANLPYAITYNNLGATPKDTGTYVVRANITSSNYTSSIIVGTFRINPASATITVTSNLNQLADGTQKVVQAVTTPIGLTLIKTYNGSLTAPSAIGSYQVILKISSPNYVGADTVTLVISSTAAPIFITNLLQQYTGFNLPVTVTTNPNGLPYIITYNGGASAQNAGSYVVIATINDGGIHIGADTQTLVVTKANPILSWPALQSIQEGVALSVIQLSPTANIAGIFSFNYPLGTILPTGTTTLVGTFTPNDLVNYNITTISVNISVYGSSINQFFIREGNIFYLEIQ